VREGNIPTVKQSFQIVSIVIPCRNEAAHIEAFVRSALAQRAGDARVEVIVADGMSNDGPREILSRLGVENSRLRVVENPQRIVSSGLNRAIAQSAGQVIIRMDAHTDYSPEYVAKCLEVLQETGADNVGGPWVAQGEGYIGRAIAAAFQSPFAVGGARGHDPHYEGTIDTVYLGCWPRNVFTKIGMFDEELVRNQDDELNLRLVRSGGKIWQSPRIQSRYRTRSSLRDLFWQYFQYGYWKVRVIQKHRIPASIRHIIPAGLVSAFVILALAAPFGFLPAVGLAILTGVYVAGLLTAALATAIQTRFSLLLILPAIFCCYHFSYGIGFLKGIWDFHVRKKTSPLAEKLTRPTISSNESSHPSGDRSSR
jgi:glycosyltransferase involved in cell wall biosynthesis